MSLCLVSLCLVSLCLKSLCLMSLCWVSFCLVSLCLVSLCLMSWWCVPLNVVMLSEALKPGLFCWASLWRVSLCLLSFCRMSWHQNKVFEKMKSFFFNVNEIETLSRLARTGKKPRTPYDCFKASRMGKIRRRRPEKTTLKRTTLLLVTWSYMKPGKLVWYKHSNLFGRAVINKKLNLWRVLLDGKIVITLSLCRFACS